MLGTDELLARNGEHGVQHTLVADTSFTELAIAHSFSEAAKEYQNNPTALHLRAMNMLYEGLKEKGAMMIIPSSAVESMGMGGLTGAAALAQQRLTASSEAQ